MEATNQDKKIAEVLAEFVVSQKYEDLPKETLEEAIHSLIDCTGCMLGASREPQAKILVEVMKEEGGTPLLQQIALRNNGVPLKKVRKLWTG